MVEMTWIEIEEMVKKDAIVLFPIGVIEEHGPHLPHGTDIFIAYKQAHDVWKKLKEMQVASIIAPPFYWGGIRALSRQFPGSFSCKKETIMAVMMDILENLNDAGFTKVILFNDHGDGLHINAIQCAVKEANQTFRLQTYWLEYEDDLEACGLTGEDFVLSLTPVAFEEMFFCDEPPKDPFDIHAGAFETAVMRECFPELVKEDQIEGLEPTLLHGEQVKRWNDGEKEDKYLISNGYVGDPQSSKYVRSHLHDINEKIALDIIKFFQLD